MLYICEERNLNSNVKAGIAVLGIVLLAPSLFDFYNFYSGLASIILPVIDSGKVDPKVMAGEISGLLVNQVLVIILDIPALITLSLVVFKFKYSAKWFRVSLKILSSFMLLTLPFLSLVSVYTFYLSGKKRTNT